MSAIGKGVPDGLSSLPVEFVGFALGPEVKKMHIDLTGGEPHKPEILSSESCFVNHTTLNSELQSISGTLYFQFEWFTLNNPVTDATQKREPAKYRTVHIKLPLMPESEPAVISHFGRQESAYTEVGSAPFPSVTTARNRRPRCCIRIPGLPSHSGAPDICAATTGP